MLIFGLSFDEKGPRSACSEEKGFALRPVERMPLKSTMFAGDSASEAAPAEIQEAYNDAESW